MPIDFEKYKTVREARSVVREFRQQKDDAIANRARIRQKITDDLAAGIITQQQADKKFAMLSRAESHAESRLNAIISSAESTSEKELARIANESKN